MLNRNKRTTKILPLTMTYDVIWQFYYDNDVIQTKNKKHILTNLRDYAEHIDISIVDRKFNEQCTCLAIQP